MIIYFESDVFDEWVNNRYDKIYMNNTLYFSIPKYKTNDLRDFRYTADYGHFHNLDGKLYLYENINDCVTETQKQIEYEYNVFVEIEDCYRKNGYVLDDYIIMKISVNQCRHLLIRRDKNDKLYTFGVVSCKDVKSIEQIVLNPYKTKYEKILEKYPKQKHFSDFID